MRISCEGSCFFASSAKYMPAGPAPMTAIFMRLVRGSRSSTGLGSARARRRSRRSPSSFGGQLLGDSLLQGRLVELAHPRERVRIDDFDALRALLLGQAEAKQEGAEPLHVGRRHARPR